MIKTNKTKQKLKSGKESPVGEKQDNLRKRTQEFQAETWITKIVDRKSKVFTVVC
jgi:hypothetical protein